MTTRGPSTMDRAVATRHVRPPGAILERSDATHPAVARLYPEHEGESGGVRGAVAGSLSAGPRGPAAPADRHRRLCGVSCGAQTVYPRVAHQRLGPHAAQSAGAVRRRDHAATCGSFLLVRS